MYKGKFQSKWKAEFEVFSNKQIFRSVHFKYGDQRTGMGGRKVARVRIQSLFNFIDAIKYTKSTVVDDPCTAQWSHKFVYVCICFGDFLLFCFNNLLYIKKIRPVYLVKNIK